MYKTKKEFNKMMTFHIKAKTYRQFKDVCDVLDVTMSEVIREGIKEFLKEHEDVLKRVKKG